jgi:hypothetical protein
MRGSKVKLSVKTAWWSEHLWLTGDRVVWCASCTPARRTTPRAVLAVRWHRTHGPAQLEPGCEAGLVGPIAPGPLACLLDREVGPLWPDSVCGGI